MVQFPRRRKSSVTASGSSLPPDEEFQVSTSRSTDDGKEYISKPRAFLPSLRCWATGMLMSVGIIAVVVAVRCGILLSPQQINSYSVAVIRSFGALQGNDRKTKPQVFDHHNDTSPWYFDYIRECTPCSISDQQELTHFVPSLIIPGVQKAGTTFTIRILGEHPNVSFYKQETHVLDNRTSDRGQNVLNQCAVWSDYKRVHSQCANCQDRQFYVDKTVEYLFQSHVIPSRLACVFQKPKKILILLRNPTARAYSDYQMFLRLKRQGYTGESNEFHEIIQYESGAIADAGVLPGSARKEGFEAWKKYFTGLWERRANAVKITTERNLQMNFTTRNQELDYLRPTFLSRGLYALQISHWIDILSELWSMPRETLVKEYFLILDNDDIKADTHHTTSQILNFVGLKPHKYDLKRIQNRAKINNYRPITAQEKEFLDDFYRPYNVELHNLLAPFGYEIGFAKHAAEDAIRN